jgi:rare lipoprotein A
VRLAACLAFSLGACARVAPLPPPLHAAGEPPNSAPASAPASPPAPEPAPAPVAVIEGEATYYSDRLAGRKTASGERYDPGALTAAHRTLRFGTQVRVVRVDNGRAVIVRITDRGPFGKPSRIIDLSKAAARKLDMLRAGVVHVRVEVLR